MLVDLTDSAYSGYICDQIDTGIVSAAEVHQNTRCLMTTSCATWK